MPSLAPSISRHPLLSFCLLAFVIAWPAFAAYGAGVSPAAQILLLILGSAAPAIAALVISSFTQDRKAVRRRVGRWRTAPVWYLLGLALPTATWLVSALATSRLVSPVSLTSTAFLLFPVVLATNFLEESGWRGFALPHLLARFTPLASSLVLGLIWSLFHAPLYWQRPIEGLLFLAPIIPISFIVTWLFLRAGESVPVSALFHGVFNVWSLALLSGQSVHALLVAETISLIILAALLGFRFDSGLVRRDAL